MAGNFDWELNLKKRYPSGRWWGAVNEAQSYLTRLLYPNVCEQYGPGRGQAVDIFPAKEKQAPILIFIHGGYFKALDKRSYSFIAAKYVKLGFTTVLVNYDLCPFVTVQAITEQVQSSIKWIHKNIHCWNGDPHNMVLCGHSVGAFLVSKLLRQYPVHSLKGIKLAVLLSGIYDLKPLKNSYLNDWLNLSQGDVEQLNEMTPLPKNATPLLVAAGGNETHEFIRQSREYAALQGAPQLEGGLTLLEKHNHYTMVRMLTDNKSPIQQGILAHCLTEPISR